MSLSKGWTQHALESVYQFAEMYTPKGRASIGDYPMFENLFAIFVDGADLPCKIVWEKRIFEAKGGVVQEGIKRTPTSSSVTSGTLLKSVLGVMSLHWIR